MSSAAPFASLSVVLPAYNEAKRIADTVNEIRAYLATKPYRFELIVAADGNDGTRERAREIATGDARIVVIGHESRAGKGRGVRDGVQIATGEIIGFVDADNKTPIDEFDKFESELAAGADVVIGSRRLRHSQIEKPQALYRRIGSRVFAVGLHALIGLNDIVDTQCGFKFFRRQAALRIFQQQHIDGYMFDVEILHLASQAGYRIAQVPVRWRDDGDSRLNLVSGNLRNVADILRIRFGRRTLDRVDQKIEGRV